MWLIGGKEQMGKIVLFLLLCSLSLINIALAQNNSHEFDDEKYWEMRRQEATRRNTEAYNPNPYKVTDQINQRARMVMEKIGVNSTRRSLKQKYHGSCVVTNPIDACWRCNKNWAKNRKKLAKCALGFGFGTTGGMKGKKYVVTDSSDNDMVNPKPGTLRHAVIQREPLWIIFATHMTIKLNQELIVTSNKTIDGRGSNVIIAEGGGITVQYVENVIIHGIKFQNIVSGPGGMIRDSVDHFGFRTRSDGDAISIFGAHHVWVDHCSFIKADDGLVDIIQASTAITISNCHMTHHDKVFLFGGQDSFSEDRKMQITIAYTHFGKGLVQRMPRCRYGFFHLVNNDYTHWLMYAIGGSQNPTILSQGNRFIAPPNVRAREITHRENPQSSWDSGIWRSEHDLLLNGATFEQSDGNVPSSYRNQHLIRALPGTHVADMTRFAGPLKCVPNFPC